MVCNQPQKISVFQQNVLQKTKWVSNTCGPLTPDTLACLWKVASQSTLCHRCLSMLSLVPESGSYRLLSNNLIAVCWCIHVCTTSRITRVLVRACWSDIVCQTMWLVDPWHACLLVESCVPIYFVPQVCATGCQCCHWLRIMCWCIHVCTTSQITRVLVRACWSDIVCQTMWLVDPWHACLLVESCVPIYFVPQVLVNLVIGLGSCADAYMFAQLPKSPEYSYEPVDQT